MEKWTEKKKTRAEAVTACPLLPNHLRPPTFPATSLSEHSTSRSIQLMIDRSSNARGTHRVQENENMYRLRLQRTAFV